MGNLITFIVLIAFLASVLTTETLGQIPDSPRDPKSNGNIPESPRDSKSNGNIPDSPRSPKSNENIPESPRAPKPNDNIPESPASPKMSKENIPISPRNPNTTPEIPSSPPNPNSTATTRIVVPLQTLPLRPGRDIISRVNNGVSTILNGVQSGSLEKILRGSFLFTGNENVRSVANTVLDSVFPLAAAENSRQAQQVSSSATTNTNVLIDPRSGGIVKDASFAEAVATVTPTSVREGRDVITRVNYGVSTILNGVRAGSLEQILRGSFIFTRNDNVRSVANNVIDGVFLRGGLQAAVPDVPQAMQQPLKDTVVQS